MSNENAKRDSNRVPVGLAYTGTDVKMLRCDSSGNLNVNSNGASGTPEHHNGSVGTSPATITFSGSSESINVHNTHASNDLLVSFDSGATFYTLEAGSYWNVALAAATFKIKGSAASTTYEIVAIIAA